VVQAHYPKFRYFAATIVHSNFLQIKQDVNNLVMDRLSETMSDSVKAALMIKKPLKV
jgi:hypothetical protein